jgi:ferritin-like metal-binding protein YciE
MLDILKLDHLFERDLEIIYDCESRSVKEFSKIIPKVSSVRLQSAFNNDLAQTTTHLERLNRIFASRDSLPVDELDHTLKSIFHEGEELIKSIDPSALLDSALIIFGSQIHHHKIALYGSLWTLARALGLTEAVEPLEQGMNEEKAAAETLVQIGLQSVMPDAVNVGNRPHRWEII